MGNPVEAVGGFLGGLFGKKEEAAAPEAPKVDEKAEKKKARVAALGRAMRGEEKYAY